MLRMPFMFYFIYRFHGDKLEPVAIGFFLYDHQITVLTSHHIVIQEEKVSVEKFCLLGFNFEINAGLSY